ncbi:tetratricopeptide repeat domain-containing protein [Coccidioides immitis RS]|uniref:ER membrane protein complex subunit 2 n=3 Tax=Coccidioides immitis TaxID=5501 RepID=J3K3F4_COCIM|nr:tetratricopeptide repeat domain-containing protein [Coccidioides immitis RS]EAS28712.3 tetratricopeptide repeat domain-containing protein [Coccidioides immitis RS]KMP05819.1 TPR repeat protein Oca3 [Coccidioides immitis RMSCC 2394]KMU81552.1 hypothetical protein CISG_09114 [Coccidioides immitis RMSCC 3703]
MDFTPAHSQMKLRSSHIHSLLDLSKQAPAILRNPPGSHLFPLTLFSKPETPELWANYENLLVACLATKDDKCALDCLQRMTTRFGPANERVMGLRGLYEEALAENEAALESILRGYDLVLKDNPVNVPILKRRVALLRSMARNTDAISALVEFLDAFPTDADAWCELSSLYECQGLHAQAIFCLEEALLVVPNAWNLHARLGEMLYKSTVLSSNTEAALRVLAESVKRFCRSIELCDGYVRGYIGLQLSSKRLLELIDVKSEGKESDLPPVDVVHKLHQLATHKLQHVEV